MTGDWLNSFAKEVRRLADASSTTETTYYSVTLALLTAVLAEPRRCPAVSRIWSN